MASRKRRSRRGPKASRPKATEAKYRSALRARIAEVKGGVIRAAVTSAIARGRALVSRAFSDSAARSIARQVWDTGEGANRRMFQQLYSDFLEVDVMGAEPWLEPAREQFIRDNTRLIKNIGESLRQDIERVVSEGIRNGVPTNRIAAQLNERFGVSASRAKLIARDQAGKLNGQLTNRRFKDNGVRKAIWRTSADERVRSRHRELDGVVFELDNPPVSGVYGERALPGVPINCRCTAEPILPEFDD